MDLKQSDVDRVQALLERIKPSRRSASFKSAWRNATLFMEGELKKSLSGAILHVRSGALRNSIGSLIKFGDKEKDTVSLIGSGVRTGDRVKYADILERGGTIKPVNGKYLTIPFPFAQTPAGVTKFTARELFQNDPKNVFISHGIIWQKTGKTDRSIRPMFSLVKSVTITAKHYMKKTVERNSARVVKKIEQWLKESARSK